MYALLVRGRLCWSWLGRYMSYPLRSPLDTCSYALIVVDLFDTYLHTYMHV